MIRQARPVGQYIIGKEKEVRRHDSVNKAARAMNVSSASMCLHLKKPGSTCAGYVFRYIDQGATLTIETVEEPEEMELDAEPLLVDVKDEGDQWLSTYEKVLRRRKNVIS